MKFSTIFLCMTCFSIRIVMLLNLKILKLALGSCVGIKIFWTSWNNMKQPTDSSSWRSWIGKMCVFFAPKIGPPKKSCHIKSVMVQGRSWIAPPNQMFLLGMPLSNPGVDSQRFFRNMSFCVQEMAWDSATDHQEKQKHISSSARWTNTCTQMVFVLKDRNCTAEVGTSAHDMQQSVLSAEAADFIQWKRKLESTI